MKCRPTTVWILMFETIIIFLKFDSWIIGLLKYVETGRRCYLTIILHYVELNKEPIFLPHKISFYYETLAWNEWSVPNWMRVGIRCLQHKNPHDFISDEQI
jgi:hypothetical protein